MDEAKKLLLTTSLTTREIAMNIGYDNPNHFYNPFKKTTGFTPEQYRQQMRGCVLHFPREGDVEIADTTHV